MLVPRYLGILIIVMMPNSEMWMGTVIWIFLLLTMRKVVGRRIAFI